MIIRFYIVGYFQNYVLKNEEGKIVEQIREFLLLKLNGKNFSKGIISFAKHALRH